MQNLEIIEQKLDEILKALKKPVPVTKKLTVKEAAKYAKCSIHTMYELLSEPKPKISYTKPNDKQKMVSIEDLDEYLNQGKRMGEMELNKEVAKRFTK